jgi:hypothetical protein
MRSLLHRLFSRPGTRAFDAASSGRRWEGAHRRRTEHSDPGRCDHGRATVVLASGELVEVAAERIVYSQATAHLFEQAQAVGMAAGNAALKPQANNGWAIHNFEVEGLHTYVAGGVRVHNKSGFL